jgi:signal transduction histidine kinase
MLAVCAGIGASVVLGPTTPRIPLAVWLLLFSGAFVAILIASVCETRPRLQRGAFGCAVVLGWGSLLTAPDAGMLAIVVAAITAFGSHLLSFRAIVGLIGLNGVVIAIAWSRFSDTPGDLFFSVGLHVLIQFAAVLSVLAILREQRMRRELTEAHVELQTVGVLLEDSARTAERLRISRDLHDLIGHQLTVLTLELETARHREGAQAREHIERAGRVARDLLGDVRSTVNTLRAQPEGDLAASLRRIGRDVPGLDVTVEVAEDVQTDEEQAATLLRVTQETVTNALRHAEARELWIDITREGQEIVFTASDDGRGARDVVPGNGLKGLAERVEALGGSVDVDGGNGFRVTARVPAR